VVLKEEDANDGRDGGDEEAYEEKAVVWH